jgi:hypothetical protein
MCGARALPTSFAPGLGCLSRPIDNGQVPKTRMVSADLESAGRSRSWLGVQIGKSTQRVTLVSRSRHLG